MPSVRATVNASIGLHARPAAEFVRAVSETLLPVTISREGEVPVDARSLLEVMTADFVKGDVVILALEDFTYRSPAAAIALEDLRAVLEAQK